MGGYLKGAARTARAARRELAGQTAHWAIPVRGQRLLLQQWQTVIHPRPATTRFPLSVESYADAALRAAESARAPGPGQAGWLPNLDRNHTHCLQGCPLPF